ncbi:unnamed protein product [Angiostrongylus costaricensis]|uniref:Uncharacterized protein n=1 Tax=Angiostrongylus costaricensis TaxID=334426 RepID=A0A0R3PDH5_ANGCS|nr:unnamed protein product [Angiostrongylus costaricensis]
MSANDRPASSSRSPPLLCGQESRKLDQYTELTSRAGGGASVGRRSTPTGTISTFDGRCPRIHPVLTDFPP